MWKLHTTCANGNAPAMHQSVTVNADGMTLYVTRVLVGESVKPSDRCEKCCKSFAGSDEAVTVRLAKEC